MNSHSLCRQLTIVVAMAFTLVTTGYAEPILVDNQADSGELGGSSGTLSGFTVGNNDNRMLVVAVGGEVGSVTGVTYGGTPLTMSANVDSSTTGGPSTASIWTLANPTVGSADIDVSIGGTTNSFLIGALSLTSDGTLGVVASDTAGSSGGGTPTLTFSPLDTADDYFMVGVAERNDNSTIGTPTPSAGLLNLFTDTSMTGGASTRADFGFFNDTMNDSFTWSLGSRHAVAGIAIQAETQAVPEPASLALWAMLGLLATISVVRRHR